MNNSNHFNPSHDLNSMLTAERPVEVSGTTAICKPWKFDQQEVHVDHKRNVAQIGSALKHQHRNGLAKLIVIEGKPGSGKTTLSQVLLNSAENVELFNAVELGYSPSNKPSLKGRLNDPRKTYLIDDALFFEESSLLSEIDKHIYRSNGIGVIFSQHCRRLITYPHICYFTLTRDGLKLDPS